MQQLTVNSKHFKGIDILQIILRMEKLANDGRNHRNMNPTLSRKFNGLPMK